MAAVEYTIPSLQAVSPEAAPLGSHPTHPALGQLRKKGSPTPNKHRAAPLRVRLLLGREGAKAPLFGSSISPDRVVAGTRSLEGWRTCLKEAPSPGCLDQSPSVPLDLCSLLPPALSSTVTPNPSTSLSMMRAGSRHILFLALPTETTRPEISPRSLSFSHATSLGREILRALTFT